MPATLTTFRVEISDPDGHPLVFSLDLHEDQIAAMRSEHGLNYWEAADKIIRDSLPISIKRIESYEDDDDSPYCEDFPCCGHTAADPCRYTGPTADDMLADPARHHLGCDHNTLYCEYEARDEDEE